jgi:alanine dehydrogenase
LKYALALADLGWKEALRRDSGLALGLNVHEGAIYYQAVGEAHGLPASKWTF